MDLLLTSLPGRILGQLADIFLSWGSMFSAASLLSALVIAVASVCGARARRGKPVKLRVLVRALFPRRLLRSASSKADLGLFLLNTFPAGALIGWAIFSADQISRPVARLLPSVIGPSPHIALGETASRAIATVALYLAYELAYWIDHYLSHKIPALWAFHKVHHTSEVLSPLTVFRVHPIDTLVFMNIVAVIVGVTAGGLQHLFGQAVSPLSLSGANVILVAFVFLTVHLQHSHVWISFPGVWGRIFMSPAHHQVHHSADPIHFDRNFGSCLSVWDWAFGTLHMPSRTRDPLTFGVGVGAHHSVTGTLITPFVECLGRLPRLRPSPRSAADWARNGWSPPHPP